MHHWRDLVRSWSLKRLRRLFGEHVARLIQEERRCRRKNEGGSDLKKRKIARVFELTDKGRKALLFVEHIEQHLKEMFPEKSQEELVVKCKVCEKTIDEISAERQPAYKTLEQQIQDLWASRGLEVIEETFEGLEENKFKWTITAKEVNKV